MSGGQSRGAHQLLAEAAGSFRQQSFAKRATQLLREQILNGQFEPGERLNELAISEHLQISRSPIREALQSLAGQGLVRVIPGRGAFVMELDVATIQELGEVRIALETHAARLAAESASATALDSLESLLEVAGTSVRNDRSYPADRDFHGAVLRLTGNQQLSQYYEEVNTRLVLARARSGNVPSRAAEAFREHQVILAALRNGATERAADAMEQHLRNAISNILEVVGARDDTSADRFME